MADAPRWRLTRSTELALDWAVWFCGSRGGSAVDSIDLLLGVIFAHPESSEPLQLLDHFRISGGALKDAIIKPHPEHRITSTSNIPAAPPRRSPSLEIAGDAEAVLERAVKLARQSGADEGLARVKDAFGAMLELPDTPVAQMLARLLESNNVSYSISTLAVEYQEFLKVDSTDNYSAFLAKRSPFAARVLALPRYDADTVFPRDRDGGDSDRPLIPDLVGIGGEVNAFAHLLAARDLQPPLAIGLFGDWGSGKSFFMRELQRRIYEITDRARKSGTPQRDLRIYKSVAQIDFNAWHYVEGNLWASLVDHIFQNLRTSAGEKDTDLIERRQELAQEVASTQIARELVNREIDELQTRKREAVADLERLQAMQQDAIEKGVDVGPITKAALDGLKTNTKVNDAMLRLGLDPAIGSAQELAAAVHDARLTIQAGAGVIGRLRTQPWQRTLAIGVVAAMIVVGVSAVLFAVEVTDVRNLVASATALIGVVTVIVRQSSTWMRARLDDLEQIEGTLRKAERADELERTRVTGEIQQFDAALTAARERATALDAHVEELRRSLDELTPGQLLASFIDRRAASDDYRRFLGVPAIVRRDFEKLSQFLVKSNREFVNDDDGKTELGKGTVNRIVLYIDDLDRCPPAVVVKVLQAVHLLLAFPLFVVVVAVDARWLASSLEQHYAHLLSARANRGGNGSDHARPPDGPTPQATPDDYLEKIFQIPFRVRELEPGARRRIVEGLLAPSVALDGHEGEEGTGDDEPNASMDAALLRRTQQRIFGRDGADSGMNPDSLRILAHELEFMKSLAPITGDSPRAVKRFVNVYRLMKALEEPRESTFTNDAPFAPYQYVMFLLAAVTGLPEISADLCSAIRDPEPDRDQLLQIAEAINAKARTPDERRQSAALVAWLRDASATPDPDETLTWATKSVGDMEKWVESIARFSFGSEVVEPMPGMAPPIVPPVVPPVPDAIKPRSKRPTRRSPSRTPKDVKA